MQFCPLRAGRWRTVSLTGVRFFYVVKGASRVCLKILGIIGIWRKQQERRLNHV